MTAEQLCPKPGCGRPETTSRTSGGKRLSICGNGHSWDPEQVSAQRERAEQAKQSEDRLSGIDLEAIRRAYPQRNPKES